MATIWKFPLRVADEQVVDMPIAYQVLSVGIDPATGGLAMWAIVMAGQMQTRRRFAVRGTGHPLDLGDPMTFVGTVIDQATGLVWHVFDGGPA